MIVNKSKVYQHMIAKTDPKRSGRYLSLADHLEDTAAVADYLVRTWVSESIYQSVGFEKEEFRRIIIFLAWTHDLGKTSSAFQAKISETFPEVKEWLAPLTLVRPVSAETKYAWHPHIGAAILCEYGAPDWAVSVVGAHHGKTMDISTDEVMDECRKKYLYGRTEDAEIWRGVWKEIIQKGLERAGYASMDELPRDVTQPAQMLLTGLLIVADWLASNSTFFPLMDVESACGGERDPARSERAIQKINLPRKWEPSDEWAYGELCCSRFEKIAEANAVQKAIQKAAGEAEKPGLFILEAPMGMGKTEAALAAGEILANRIGEGGLAFFLPSQATANAMYDRIVEWIKNFTQQGDLWDDFLEDDLPPESLSIELAHGKATLNERFAELSEQVGSVNVDETAFSDQGKKKVSKEEEKKSAKADADAGISTHAFFMGRKTQLLADFVVGTVDQLLLGALKQKHIMLKHLGLAGKVVVVDEVHAYDTYMSRFMDAMLNWLGAYHTPVILLSATLPGRRRAEMVSAYLGKADFERREGLETERTYPLLTWTDGEQVWTQTVESDAPRTEVDILRGEDEDVTSFLRDRLKDGGCAGVIVNTVKRAQAFAERLKTAFPEKQILLDHAQFVMPDRMSREKELMKRLGRDSTPEQRDGLIVVGTQVLEQSLDIDFDIMITDLCPMDLLLQRLGRLHRKAGRIRPRSVQQAACMVLGTDNDRLEDGAKAIYGDYLLMKTSCLLKEKIRLPEDIPQLVQDTYNQNVDHNLSNGTGIEKKWEEYNEETARRQSKANAICIPNAPKKLGRRRSTRVIDSLFYEESGMGELQAEATVRDGVQSIEVLVLRYGGDGMLHTVTDGKTLVLAPNALPSKEEAEIIAKQSLRLPYVFSQPWMMKKTIEELECIRQTKLEEWCSSPRVGRELFLLLDENGKATLAGMKLVYDGEMGLRYEKEEEDGGKSV